MADTKISAAADIVSVVATDMLPVARSGSTTAYHATMAEMATWATTNLPTASTTVLGGVKIDGTSVTISSGTISAVTPLSSTNPLMDGTTNPGTGTTVSRTDHVHPSDTTRAPLASPTFTGSPAAPTPTAGDSSTKLATTAFVATSFAPLASPTFTGTPSMPTGTTAVTQAVGTSNTALATTAFVQAAAAPAFNDVGRNRLHNVGFTVNQRNYTTGTALAAAAYGHDRWKAGSGGCTYTFTASPPLTTITITAGSLQQIIEATGIEGGTYTLSWAGTAQGRVNAGTYAASPVTVTGLGANTAITVEFNAGTLSRAQFEAGAVATTLDKGGSPQAVLAECQRFYNLIPGFMTSGYTAAGSSVYSELVYPVAMRAVPAVAMANNSYSNASALTVNSAAATHCRFTVTVTAIGMGWGAADITFSADL